MNRYSFCIVASESRDLVKLGYFTQCKFKSHHHLSYTQMSHDCCKNKVAAMTLSKVTDGLTCINSTF